MLSYYRDVLHLGSLEYVVWIQWWLADILSDKYPMEGFIDFLSSFSVISPEVVLSLAMVSFSSSVGVDVCPKVFRIDDKVKCYLSLVAVLC